MFFILSKVLNFLIMPFTLVCLLFLLSAVTKSQRWNKRFFWAAFVSLLFFSNDFISNEIMNLWEMKTIAYKDMRPHDLGIVLTGATVPLLKPDDRVYFQRGADRVTHTVQLYKLGLLKKIMISGVSITPNINPPTGIYSEDGAHPNSRGYAFLSRVFIEAINTKFGATIPLTDISKYKATALPIP